MENITLENYISSLATYFRNPSDSRTQKVESRMRKLNSFYGTEYLKKVYEDTNKVFINALRQTTEYYPGYWIIPILGNQTSHITLLDDNLPSDAIYITEDGKMVSDRLFKKLLGSNFSMCISYDYQSEKDEKCNTYILFQGTQEALKNLREAHGMQEQNHRFR